MAPFKQIFLKDIDFYSAILLLISTVIALGLSNSPLNPYYENILHVQLFGHTTFQWINDGFMTFFFLLIGLQLKREFYNIKLRTLALPIFAALGGILLPAIIYSAFCWEQPDAIRGWAIPTATDVAFALGVLALLNHRVPFSLRLLLLSIAIFDDIVAILIIALYYVGNLSLEYVVMALLVSWFLTIINRFHVNAISVYVLIGLVLWYLILKSGVHPTLAGVIVAFCVPIVEPDAVSSPVNRLEILLQPWVAILILPLFALANAGVNISQFSPETLFSPVSLGILLGFLIGKPLGVFIFSWGAIKLNLAQLPKDISWASLYGMAVLCGIGFTMSLFIGTLAFNENSPYAMLDQAGVLVGSFISAIIGSIILHFSLKAKPAR